MNKIFIEAGHQKTSEYNFLKTILVKNFPGKNVEIICMNGVANLFSEAILNMIRQAADDSDKVLVIVDADFPNKNWGFAKRKQDVMEQMKAKNVFFPFFIYPNNHDDGDVETLMESLARKDLHKDWWGCFEDYETCVGGAKDEEGNPKYNLPNRKAKLHTYISSQSLSKKQRDKIGVGSWLFDDVNYWDLSREELKPLISFLRNNLI